MKYVKKFEAFSPYDDEPLSRLEKQFSEIIVNGLTGEDDIYWSAFNALKIELKEIIDEEDPLYKEMMHKIVEGENPTEVMNYIFSKVKLTPESKRLLSKINSLSESLLNKSDETEVKFVSKRRQDLAFNVYKTLDGRITRIEKPDHVHIRFPFAIGQVLNRSVETWACNNGFYINGKDTCAEEKVFGIKKSDIPKGHELRHLFPQKFR